MHYTKDTWIKITVPLEGGVTQWPDIKKSILTLLLQVNPRRHPSSLWERTILIESGIATSWKYEVLIAGLKPRDEMIFKDLGYNMTAIEVCKATRKKHYKRIIKDDNRTK